MRARDFIFEDTASRQQERLEHVTTVLKNHPSLVDKIYRAIRLEAEPEDNINIPDTLKGPGYVGKEQDHLATNDVFDFVVKTIVSTTGDYNDIEEFVSTFGEHEYINIELLMSSGRHSFDDWLQVPKKTRNEKNKTVGISKQFIKEIFMNLYNPPVKNIKGSNRGPGELALAVLDSRITFATIGDLVINGEYVEVKSQKGEKDAGGRLRNTSSDFNSVSLHNVVKLYKPKDADIENKHPDDLSDKQRQELEQYNRLIAQANESHKKSIVSAFAGDKAQNKTNNICKIANEFEAIVKGSGEAVIKEYISSFVHASHFPKITREILSNWKKNWGKVDLAFRRLSYGNYLQVLGKKSFKSFLFLNLGDESSQALAADTDNWEEFNKYIELKPLNWDDGYNGPATQTIMRVLPKK